MLDNGEKKTYCLKQRRIGFHLFRGTGDAAMASVMLRISAVFGLLVAFGPAKPLSGQAPPAPQPLEWNVFLANWQVLGPFPKPDQSSGGTHAKFVENEAELRPGALIVYDKKFYMWRPAGKAVVHFRDVLKAQGTAGDHVVGYAWTEFQSPAAQRAVLAIGHDDSVAAWLNGKEVYRNDGALTASYLDQAKVEVDLKEGMNTLLLKIGQGVRGWEAHARLLPPGADKPLVTLAAEHPAGAAFARAPVLDLELLDAAGKTIDRMRTSGFRNQNPPGLRYLAYAPDPEAPPASLRIRYAQEGFLPFDRTVPWSEVAGGTFQIPFEANRPIAGRVVDAMTGQPIAGARFWSGTERTAVTTNERGVFRIEDAPALATHYWIAAPGYAAKQSWLAWPRSDEQVFRLERGGQVLEGRVVSQEDGRPLEGARIELGLSSGFQPHGATDAEGRFEIAGIPADKPRLYPVITCPDHVAKDRFGLDMDPAGVTTVEWSLAPGAVIAGRVTAEENGRPIAGVTVTTGHDRFGSNHADPATTTDAQGRFRLSVVPRGQTFVHAFSEQHAPAMTNVTTGADPLEVNFELSPGEAATGRVTDPQGKPIADVWLVTDTWSGARMFRRETRTAADGSFLLEHMPATPAEVHVLKKDYVSKRDLMLKGGDHVDVILPPVIEHTVRIRLAARDEPVPDLQIQKGYRWTGREEINWQSGSYEGERYYDKATGVFKIAMSESYDADISWRFRYPGYRDAVVAVPRNATEPKSFDVTLEKVPAFRGRVVAADTGETLEGVSVALVSKEDRLRIDHYVQYKHPADGLNEFTGVHATTGADGAFELPRPENPQATNLVLTMPEGGFLYLPDVESWLGAEPCELPYPEHGAIEGTITIAGNPASGEIVHAQWLPPSGGDSWDLPFGVGGQVTADAEGRYRFRGLGPGRYRISRVRAFDRPGGGGMSMYMLGEEVVLLPGRTLIHDVAQAPGHTVAGQTLGPRGKPLGNCIITASVVNAETGGNDRIDAVRADDQGRFAFRHLPAGSYRFSADHYSITDGQQCGLGGQDYGGAEEVSIAGDAKITIKLESTLANGLAAADSLAGSLPPDFTGSPLDAEAPFQLSENWGKVIAIDFWATWCGPCMAVMPQLKALHEKYKDRDDVVFITVSLDQDEEQLRTTLKEKGLEFPVIFSGKGWNDEIARAFGVTGIPSSFVIGRDGRFAADRMHGAQLGAAIEEALAKPVDPAYASGAKPARLTVKVTLDDTELGVPGARLTLQAVNAAGESIRRDAVTLPGAAKQVVWLYPQLDRGGKVIATASAEGVAEQRKTLEAPPSDATVAFALRSPRSVSGQVTADDGRTPAPGVKVTLRGGSGFERTAVSQEDGSFRIPAVPGRYAIAVEGTEQFAPLPDRAKSVTIAADADPEPVAIDVCHAVVVQGVVVDEDGSPVSGAKVQAGAANTLADGAGRFQLPGVATVGAATIYASRDNVYGAVRLIDADGKEPQRIVLGQGLAQSSAGLRAGMDAPSLSALTLEGEAAPWRPGGERDHLVVFCALGHPAGRKFLAEAQDWASEHGAQLDTFSIDWSLAQARREAAAAGVPIRFAGPGGLEIAAAWAPESPARAYLISPEGKVIDVPKPGELPQ
jgi:thiol-disulfide isomerase/thioredoxin